MKAIRVHAVGAADVLQLADVPDPVPGPGQALVRVEATGINFVEIYHRNGWYPSTLPYTPGHEGAGTVVAVGEGVAAGPKPGDRVASTDLVGSYAELALARAERLVRLPDAVDARQAAAAMLQGMTAHYLTYSTYPLQSGDWCLVHAAAGGVGLLLCQLARRRGARVIGTTSTEAKAAAARAAGAEEVILYGKEDFVPEVRRITAGHGVAVVYDSVGRATFEGSLDCLSPRGMLVLFGQASGPVDPFELQLLNSKGSLFLTRPSLRHYIATTAELQERADAVLGWVADGSLRLHIDRTLPLDRAADAQRALEGRETIGKILLTPDA